ncbi:MAG TPA: hypothetical protein DEA55_02880 [Rhodospirillaceae bacterium]|nr:hypothetical protein [Rhodospirillaceae bacterium]
MVVSDSHKQVRRRLIVALQCFVDESSDGYGNHTVVMAGYVAEQEVWEKFNADWQAALGGQPYAVFNNKIFRGKTATAYAEKFYRIIEKHLEKAFCVTCSVPEYRALMASCRFPKSLTEAPRYVLLNDPNLFLYRAFIEFCYDERKKLDITEPVDFIFDETNKYEGIVTKIYDYLYHSATVLGMDVTAFGKKPVFEDDEKTPALQAADLLARIVRHNLVNGKEITEMPWEKLKPMKHLTTEMGEKYVLQVLETSFSEENSKIYEEYAKARHYRLYDLLNRLLKCLPAFIRVPLFRILNKPLLLG